MMMNVTENFKKDNVLEMKIKHQQYKCKIKKKLLLHKKELNKGIYNLNYY